MMVFGITSMTSGAEVGDLTIELRNAVQDNINEKYSNAEGTIYIALISILKHDHISSGVKYNLKDKCLEISVVVSVEEYKKMYKMEQRYHLGNLFLEYLRKGLEAYPIEGLNSEEFINDIVTWGKEMPIKIGYNWNEGVDVVRRYNWFRDEIDWSVDLDK